MLYLSRILVKGDEKLVAHVKSIFGDCRIQYLGHLFEFTMKLVRIGDSEERILYHLVPSELITRLVPPDRSVTITYLACRNTEGVYVPGMRITKGRTLYVSLDPLARILTEQDLQTVCL